MPNVCPPGATHRLQGAALQCGSLYHFVHRQVGHSSAGSLCNLRVLQARARSRNYSLDGSQTERSVPDACIHRHCG